MPVLTIGFGHVRLEVCDLARSRTSYDQVLGRAVAPAGDRVESRDPDGIALELIAGKG